MLSNVWTSIAGARNSVGRCHYQSAIEWVQDTDTDWLFSFTNICDLLGFDPEYLRECCSSGKTNTSSRRSQKVLSLAAMAAQH